MFRIYSLFLYIFSIFFFPYMAVRLALRGKSRAGIGQRFGFFEDGFFANAKEKRIWVHAVSVGETLAAVPIVRELLKAHQDIEVYFSTVTETGNKVAHDNFGVDVRIFYFPFDLPFSVKRVVAGINPDIFVVVETELWPNLLMELDRNGIPSVMVNGRISPRSYRGYSRARFFMKRVLGLVTAFNMQTQADADRILGLGAPRERVRVAGNVKFDQTSGSIHIGGSEVISKEVLGIPAESVVMVAGSTHQGEEEEVLRAYRGLLEIYENAFLILAPRHPERLPGVESLIKEAGLKYLLRSRISGMTSGPCIILLDTMGELSKIYRVGDVCFVGGSMVPVGGHNILEPAAFGKPVFFGPHMHNFTEIARLFRECGAGIEVKDGGRLGSEAIRLLEEPGRAARLGLIAKDVLLKNRGALERNVQTILRYLKS